MHLYPFLFNRLEFWHQKLMSGTATRQPGSVNDAFVSWLR